MTSSESWAKYAETLNAVVEDREEVAITRAGHEQVVILAFENNESSKQRAYLLRARRHRRWHV